MSDGLKSYGAPEGSCEIHNIVTDPGHSNQKCSGLILRSLEILLRSLAIKWRSLEILFCSLEIPIAFSRNTIAFSRNTIVF